MTVRIQVTLAAVPLMTPVGVTGETMAHAVRRAARRLGIVPGRSLGLIAKIDSHRCRWGWLCDGETVELLITQSRSGERGENRKIQVNLRLTEDELSALDTIADARHLDRNATVVQLVAEARETR